jgi:hypothetical protein
MLAGVLLPGFGALGEKQGMNLDHSCRAEVNQTEAFGKENITK